MRRYFSYGAAFQPSFWSVFHQPHRILEEKEGPNDGLVSVASSKWGGENSYKGTLIGVSHLDLINWSNRLKWLISEIAGKKRKFALVPCHESRADSALRLLIRLSAAGLMPLHSILILPVRVILYTIYFWPC